MTVVNICVYQAKQMSVKDKRMQQLNEAISGMKVCSYTFIYRTFNYAILLFIQLAVLLPGRPVLSMSP